MRGIGDVPREFLCVEQKLVSKPKSCGGKGRTQRSADLGNVQNCA